MDAYAEICSVSHQYNTGGTTPVLALDGVDLTVGRGEFLAVLGANGSGKSTLAKHLNALLLPEAGHVLVDGLDTRRPEHLWQVRDRVGMVFQNPDNQIVAAVVEEDVAFGPENQGLPPAEIRRRVREALAAVGMAELKDRSPHWLSGGQKQRVAIAGALAVRPVCLVLDEPTAMLDPAGRREVLQTAKALQAEAGIAVVYITHYMDEAAQADRIAVMVAGKVLFTGPPREIFRRADELSRLGLALPPAVDLAQRLRRAGVPLAEDIISLEELVEALCQLSRRT